MVLPTHHKPAAVPKLPRSGLADVPGCMRSRPIPAPSTISSIVTASTSTTPAKIAPQETRRYGVWGMPAPVTVASDVSVSCVTDIASPPDRPAGAAAGGGGAAEGTEQRPAAPPALLAAAYT